MFRKSVVIEEALESLNSNENSKLKWKLQSFALTTTINGLPQAARSQNPIARAIWLIIVGLATLAMGYHILELIRYYLKMNTTVNIEV